MRLVERRENGKDAPSREEGTERCDIVLNACRDKVLSCAEITPVLFARQMDEHMFSFAFSETLAHVNRLLREGRLVDVGEPDEPRFRSA